MSKLVAFNINDTVRVKITEKGHALLRKDHEEFFAKLASKRPYEPPKEDAEGYSRWQLWSLMQSFGPHISLGFETPFDPAILFEVKDDG